MGCLDIDDPFRLSVRNASSKEGGTTPKWGLRLITAPLLQSPGQEGLKTWKVLCVSVRVGARRSPPFLYRFLVACKTAYMLHLDPYTFAHVRVDKGPSRVGLDYTYSSRITSLFIFN